MEQIIQLGQMEGNFEYVNRVYDSDGIAPTIQTMQGGGREPKIMEIKEIVRLEKAKVRQATKEGFIECQIGGGGRLKLPNKQNKERKSDRRGNDITNTDNGEYP